ncbi:MAG: transglycosylase SLT domain-containing protein [Candidatus Saccharimonadales bacterium]
MARVVAEFHRPEVDYRQPIDAYASQPEESGYGAHVALVAAQLAAKAAWLPIAVSGKVGGAGIRAGFKLAGKELDGRFTDSVATLMAGAFAVGAVMHGYQEITEHDAPPAAFAKECNDAGHQAVVIGNSSKVNGLFSKDSVRGTLNALTLGHVAKDDRTWGDLSSYLSSSQGRGYTIVPASLAALNPDLATYNKGALKPEIAQYGPACINLPGPMFYGILLSGGNKKANDIALENGLTFAQLKTMNPGITKGDQVVEEGKVIRIKKSVDTSLVLRTYSEKQLSEVTKDPTVVTKIKVANDLNVQHGKPAYLPMIEATGLKAAGLTTADIVGQYKDSANHLTSSQTISPHIEKNPRTSIPETATLQDGTDLLRMQLAGVPNEYARYYLRYGRKFDVSPLLLAAQGSQESGWQSHHTSKDNAQGPAQILPEVFAEEKARLGLPADASIEDPRYAIEMQAAIMQENLRVAHAYNAQHGSGYSDTYVALSMYNGGVHGVETQGVSAASPGYASNIISMTDTMQRYLRPISLAGTEHKTSTGQTVPEKVRGSAYYSQTDLRWAYDAYNTGSANYTIGGNGCAPASQAIVMTTFTGRLFNPVDMARFNINNGYISPDSEGGGTDGEAAAYGMAKAFGFKAEGFNPHDGLTDEMKKFLDNGGMIILNGWTKDSSADIPATTGGHVYVIDGYTKDGKLTILNPDSISQTNKSWNPSDIFSYASYAVGIKK